MNVVTDTTEEHAIELANTMQALDVESIRLLSGQSPLEGLSTSLANSIESETWLVDGRVMAISGISQVTFLSPWACPWLLCSSDASRYPKLFMKTSKLWVEEKLNTYKWLSNYVYDGHEPSKRWLTWLGFKLYSPQPMGPFGALFCRNELKE